MCTAKNDGKNKRLISWLGNGDDRIHHGDFSSWEELFSAFPEKIDWKV